MTSSWLWRSPACSFPPPLHRSPAQTMSDLLETLTHPPEAHPKLRNWSSTYNVSPELLFHPTTNDEVALILKEAGKRGKKVRAVGLHNSPGPIWHSNQVRPHP